MQLIHTSKTDVHRAAAVATRIVKLAVRKRPLIWPVWQTLPVAGIDIPAAQSVLYQLKRTLPKDEGTATIQTWLHALQLAQVASDRLLHALSITQRHLRFWQARLKAGSHSSFLLLARGPGGFAADVLELLGLREQQQSGISASDRIEERIVALKLLSSQLAEALVAVHKAADGLRLAAASSQQEQQQDVQHQVLAAVSNCLQAHTAALQVLMPAAAQLQEQDVAVRHLSAAGLQSLPSHRTQQQQQQPQRPQQQRPQQQQEQQQSSVSMQQVQEQLQDLSKLLHVRSKELTSIHSADASAALGAASRLAAELGPLVGVPQWAAMPSSLQRHWIKYAFAGGLGVYAGVFLYRNSRLAGSPNLDNWVAAGAAAVEGAWGNHIVTPLVTVRDELFATFRDRPSIVSTAEFEADKASLLRMLADFQRDRPQTAAALAAIAAADNGSSSSAALVDPQADIMNIDAVNKGMQVVMQCYENDLKAPIRGLVTGELARTLLIQVQRLKLDTEAAMLELDQILRANELSISLVAAVPALLLTWTLLRGLWVLLLVRAPPDARREATPCRLAMAELERALAALAALQSSQAAGSQAAPVTTQHLGAAVSGEGGQKAASTLAAAEGMVLYKLYKVYREVQALYRLKDSSSRYSDWPHLSADLLSMVGPSEPPAAKLELHKRMLRTYCVLQP